MSNNRLRLNGTVQDIEITFSNLDIISTSATEIIRLKAGVQNVTKNISGDDEFIINGNIEDYDITSPGGNIVNLTQGGNTIELSIGSGTGKLGFANGKGNIEIVGGTPNFASTPLSGSPLNPGSVSLTPIPDSRVQVTKNTSEMVSAGTTQSSPFDASDEDSLYVFELDANQLNQFYIDSFSSKDKIRFINSPTGNDGDLNISNTNYLDGCVQLTVGDTDVYLSGLACAAMWDASSFRTLLGSESLEIT